MKIKWFLFPLFAISLILTGLNTASAVSVGIKNSNSLKVSKTLACTSQNIMVGADAAYKIVVSSIPTSCLGKSLSVQVIATDEPTTRLLTGTTNSSVTFSNAVINPATITKVKVAIAGWQVPSTWLWDLPALHIDASTPNVSISNLWTQYSPTSFCVTSTISTTSNTNIPWTMNLVSNKYPFNGDINAAHYIFTPSGNYRFASTTPTNGIFKVIGSKVPTGRVKAGAPQNVTICNSLTPLPQ